MRLKATLRLHTGQETKREPPLGLSCAAGDGCGAGRLREDASDHGLVGIAQRRGVSGGRRTPGKARFARPACVSLQIRASGRPAAIQGDFYGIGLA